LLGVALLGATLIAPGGCEEIPAELLELLGVDIAVTQSVTNATLGVGALTSFEIKVKNNGPVEVDEVTGIDSLSSGLGYESYSISGKGWFDPVARVWGVSKLAVGEEVRLTILARAMPGTEGTTQSNVFRIDLASELVQDSVASNDRRSSSVTISSVPVSAFSYTNEPPGFVARSTWDWAVHSGGGWKDEGPNPVTGAFQSVVSSGYGSAPPIGGPNVLQATYIAGSTCCSGAGRTYYGFNPPVNEVFVGYWQKFESTFRASDNSMKMSFFIMGNERAFNGFIERADVVPARWACLSKKVVNAAELQECGQPAWGFPLGEWFKTEWYIKLNTPGQANGVLRIWYDGVKTHDLTNLIYDGPVTNFYFEGTHNGEIINGVRIIPTAMHWWVAHAYVSVPAP